jgi:Uma2 family endonuclease
MATERQQPQPWLYQVEPWPPDDTEESVLGTDLHQSTIRYLAGAINMAARAGLRREEPSPWRALTQLEYLGCRRPDGSPLRTYPDLFVFRHAIDPLRGSFSLQIDGPPALLIEVLSESTYKSDLNLERGKAFSYRDAGAPEYLVFDPTYALLREGILGWQLVDERYETWRPAVGGRLYSRQLPLAFALEGALARVFLGDGTPMPRDEEMWEALARRDTDLARKDADLARERAEVVRLRRLLAGRE